MKVRPSNKPREITYKNIPGKFDQEELYTFLHNESREGDTVVEYFGGEGKSSIYMGSLLNGSLKDITFRTMDYYEDLEDLHNLIFYMTRTDTHKVIKPAFFTYPDKVADEDKLYACILNFHNIKDDDEEHIFTPYMLTFKCLQAVRYGGIVCGTGWKDKQINKIIRKIHNKYPHYGLITDIDEDYWMIKKRYKKNEDEL